MTTTTIDTEVKFEVKFQGKGPDGKVTDNKPALCYDKDKESFSLKDGPLDVGTIDDLGASVASFFGGHFPDTDSIPVIGTIMKSLGFRINTLDYTGKTKTESDSFDLELDIVPSPAGTPPMAIGLATVTDIDIAISKPATKLA
ncbi:hypothetical protein A9Q81_12975 [Gammaproteobacteria bacterium 42_54_T18]|nr:hypothetical protein A9Q81_12975 [Gammaproteobacteria bacterium 42_54_T18]